MTEVDDFITDLNRGKYQGTYDSFSHDSIWAICEIHKIPADNPKLDKLSNVAWDFGHSGGYHEVWFYMNEMAGLIK